jgi:ketosteroid isomerase-like protein
MRRNVVCAALVSLMLLFVPLTDAGPTSKAAENPAHEELRRLRRGLVSAVEQADLDLMLTFLHRDVVVTWLNGEQSRGHEQVREYYNRMVKGDKRVVESFHLEEVEPAELTTLYGDNAGVAHGTATSRFVMKDGGDFTISGPWTATVVKQDGKWLVAAFHTSTNMFDNPILKLALGWIGRAAALAAIAGFVLGIALVLIVRRFRRKPTTILSASG